MDLGQFLKKHFDVNFFSCMQCISCSNGCPFADIMDMPPHMLIRLLHLRLYKKVLYSNTPWMCVGCNSCTYVCPMAIDIPLLLDRIKEYIIKNRLVIKAPKTYEFHKEVLNSIKRYGKIHKLGIMFNFKLKNLDFFSDIGMGLKMLVKRKVELIPPSFDQLKEIKEIFDES